MQLGNVTTDHTKDYGITFARQQFNGSQSATVKNDAGEDVPNPALFANDYDYALDRLGAMIASAIDSWARQADEAAANPPPTGGPGGVTADWRPQAQADLGIWKVKVNGILSQMFTVYSSKGEAAAAYASAVAAAIEAVSIIHTSGLIVAALNADPGSRAAFDLATKQAWLQIVAPTPPQVKVDFANYSSGTL